MHFVPIACVTEHVVAVERAMVAIRRSQTRRAMSRVADGPAIDPSVFGVLDAVDVLGRPATVSEVGAELGVDQPRASRLVARAVNDGLVARGVDQRDARRGVAHAHRPRPRAARFRA